MDDRDEEEEMITLLTIDATQEGGTTAVDDTPATGEETDEDNDTPTIDTGLITEINGRESLSKAA